MCDLKLFLFCVSFFTCKVIAQIFYISCQKEEETSVGEVALSLTWKPLNYCLFLPLDSPSLMATHIMRTSGNVDQLDVQEGRSNSWQFLATPWLKKRHILEETTEIFK